MQSYDIPVTDENLKESVTAVENGVQINEIDDNNKDYLIAPWGNNSKFRADLVGEMLDPKEVLKNTPRKSGNYIEVPVVIANE